MLASDMASGFTRHRLEAIAALANLELEPSEIELFARQLQDILTYAEAVQQVDTTGVPPTTSVGAGHTGDREDLVRPSLDVESALANAPEKAPGSGFFRVPRVIG